MADRTGQPAGQHSPGVATAPLPPAADLHRALARYKIASAATTQAARHATTRNLTDVELGDLRYLRDVMRQSRTRLAHAGRLDLIGVGA